ncbi:plasmid mobilization protein [Nesterenkonia aurantiaca]|uniref:plasmid mobilization protein n=1 Tax=Nesterenkonia aurantiaca TaxID=1436010 RepID=UPI003EE44EAA
MANPNREIRPSSKGKRLTVRFDEAEDTKVRARARSMGIPSSAFVRAVVLDAIKGNSVPSSVAAAIDTPQESSSNPDEIRLGRELRTAITRIGVNYNQIARQVNKVGPQALNDPKAIEVMSELTESLRQVQDLVGKPQIKPPVDKKAEHS